MPRPDSKRRSGLPAVAVACVFLLPVLYVLSIGPVTFLQHRGRVPLEVDVLYAPLGWAAESSDTVYYVLAWYCKLFRPVDE